jgi:hypothetical protein
VPPLELPRSARLVMWGNALRAGQATVAAAVAAISGDDEPHVVTGSGGLTEWLTALVPGPAGALRLVLPAPGDPAGLPGPPAVNELAVAAGECALTPELALIPRVERFGSMVEPGHLVTWQPSPVTPRPAPGPPGLT